MKILLNVSTIRHGGAMQRAVSCFSTITHDPAGHEWSVVMSPEIADQLGRVVADSSCTTHVLDPSPARSRRSRRRLRQLERVLHPDCVFTLGGPAYVEFESPHLLSCTTPWVSHPSRLAYACQGFPFGRAKVQLSSYYKARWFRHADAWVVQTEVARQGLHRRLGLPLNRIEVVSNTCGPAFLDRPRRKPFPNAGQAVKILCIAAPYKHKRLTLIPSVAQELAARLPELDFQFVLTLLPAHPITRKIEHLADLHNVTQRIHNAGPVPVKDLPQLYEKCDICFLPTVLETFSVTYLEAMAMGLPIVTTDLGFAREVCRSAALYFVPNAPIDAAERIAALLGSKSDWEDLTRRGHIELERFPTPHDQLRQYLSILSSLTHQ